MKPVRWPYAHALLPVWFAATIIYSSANNICLNDNSDPTCQAVAQQLSFPNLGRPLRPSDLPQPALFTNFQNTTITLPNGKSQQVSSGKVSQINNVARNGSKDNGIFDDLAVLSEVVDRSSIEEILTLLREYEDYDDDPDSVDGMPSFEIFVENPRYDAEQTEEEKQKTPKYRDVDPKYVPERKALREKLNAIMKPYIDTIITPHITYLLRFLPSLTS